MPEDARNVAPAPPAADDLLEQYVGTAPSPSTAIDIFKGQWSSRLPGELASLSGGHSPLFEDDRLLFADREFGGFEGKRVLDLGPLEAGHTYMAEKLGAREVVAVEGNTRAFLKCLVVKELLGLKRARFLCGDIVEFLRHDGSRFDACIASGVLYHMVNPAELIGLLAMATDRVLLWTHYYDAEVVERLPTLARHLRVQPVHAEYRGFEHVLYRYEYQEHLALKGFGGGSRSFSNWMTRDAILDCLRHFGLGDIQIGKDDPSSSGGPSILLVARRPSTASAAA